jgi:hypothetical protein
MLRNAKLDLMMALLLAGGMWFYVQNVMIRHQLSDAARHGIPRGNLSDLYPRWLGARELLLHHRNPYSSEVTREIQIGYYGRVIDHARPYDPTDEQGFAYPVYVVFLLAPTIMLPFSVVQMGFRWLLVALTAASVPLWLRVLRWRASAWGIASLIVLVLGSFQVIQGLKLQQLSLLVSGLITGCAVLLAEGHLAAAGVLLALATIKPQLALLLSAWLMFWALSDWRSRRRFFWGFAGALAVLVVAGEIVLPGWVGRFYQALIAYRHYNNGAESALELLFTLLWGRVLTVAVLMGLVIVCWRFRRVPNYEPEFNWIMALILAATVLVVPKEAPYNQVLLVAPIFLIARNMSRLWGKDPVSRFSLVIAGLILFWPWLSAVGIVLASPVLPSAKLQNAWTLPLYTSPLIPLAVFALAALAFRDLSQSRNEPGSSQIPG